MTDKVNEKEKVFDDAFTLVNKDLGTKIKDEKFKTKPTTFAKDAFKRFCKNKSSVVGAIIIGFMLIGSFIFPLMTSDDLKTPKVDQRMLEPKLFNAGTGWWDGTRTIKKQPLDRTKISEDGTMMPAGTFDSREYTSKAIVSLKPHGESSVDITTWSQYAFGGTLVCLPDNVLPEGADPLASGNPIFLTNYHPVTMKTTDNLKLDIVFSNVDGILSSTYSSKYKIALYTKPATSLNGSSTFVMDLTDWFDYQENVHIDISSALETAGKSQQTDAQIRVIAQQRHIDDTTRVYMMIKSLRFDFDKDAVDEIRAKKFEAIEFYDHTDEEVLDLHELGIEYSDSNRVAGYTKDSKGNAPTGYWQSNAKRYSYESTIRYVDIVYDTYEHVYGDREMTIGATDIQQYINKGWCKFEGLTKKITECDGSDFNLTTNNFVVLNKKCPVKEISSATYVKGVWQFETTTTYYRYIGLNSMPRFLFGTDNQGFDLFARCFNSLKTSLLVAIICVAICLVIGLVWGSISGYFGGTVDLVMERITDIIAGLPSLVLMTLILILMGRNIIMFAFSVILTGWIGIAGTTRTQFYRFRDREYVLASKTLGASHGRLIFKHILPNGLGTIITGSVLRVPAFIASEATIAYLGIGLKTTDSFGVILSQNQQYISTYPHLIVLPALLLALLMISFNLFGNGLRDAVNPTLKGGE